MVPVMWSMADKRAPWDGCKALVVGVRQPHYGA